MLAQLMVELMDENQRRTAIALSVVLLLNLFTSLVYLLPVNPEVSDADLTVSRQIPLPAQDDQADVTISIGGRIDVHVPGRPVGQRVFFERVVLLGQDGQVRGVAEVTLVSHKIAIIPADPDQPPLSPSKRPVEGPLFLYPFESAEAEVIFSTSDVDIAPGEPIVARLEGNAGFRDFAVTTDPIAARNPSVLPPAAP